MQTHVIAIDGPSASGKSTVARRVAADIGYVYVDSGAVYRGLTWKALREGVPCRDKDRLRELLKRLTVEFYLQDGAVRFRIDGEEPGQEIRGKAVDENVSPVAALPEAREKVVGWLKGLIRFGNLVMEGRDIGTAVFPDAGHKFFLNASPAVRAGRRYAEMAARREPVAKAEVRRSIQRRDVMDSTRKKDPLRIAPGAVVIDTTELGIKEVVKLIEAGIRSGEGS